MTDKSDLLLEAAKSLLQGSSNERTIQSETIYLLKLLGITEIEAESVVSTRKRMDIFCYRLRTVIETKRIGKAGIEVLDQLEPYIHAKILEEANYLPFGTQEEQDHPWTGIITDGRIWHVWKWNNDPESKPTIVRLGNEPKTPEDLLKFLKETAFPKKPLGKPRIPADPYDLFIEDLETLKKIHTSLRGKSRTETQTKFDLWRDMLRASGMAPENEDDAKTLFVTHSFLVSTARNVSTILVSEDPEGDPSSVLNDGFVSWIVQDPDGEEWQEEFLTKINRYDWRRQKGDVLRSVYEGFISAKDRKIFGEHYTPDWLAQLLVNETLDPEWLETSIHAALSSEPLKGIGVLDPACGSGTFLYHSARKILESDAMKAEHLPLPRQAEIVVKLVHGIDIHPIAAEISRATLLRALPAPPPDGAKSVRVFQGDSLMTFQDKEDENSSFLNSMKHKIQENSLTFFLPGKPPKEIHIPISFCELPTFNYEMDRLIAFAKQEKIPQDILSKVPSNDREALEKCCHDFTKIIAEKGNSVWAWYVTNITAPAFLAKRKVNRIIANPPWVQYGNIQVPDRKRELERAFKEENLWHGGNLAHRNDIAQLFVKISRNIYMQNPKTDPAAWIVKKSVIRSTQWEKFRDWHKTISSQIVDLTQVQPFGPGGAKESAVLFDIREIKQTPQINQIHSKIIKATIISPKRKPKYNSNLSDAFELIRFEHEGTKIPQLQSEYRGDSWKVGATIFPSVLVIADTITPKTKTTIDVSTRKSRHKPWKDISVLNGEIPNEWIRNLIKSLDTFPFMVSKKPDKAIIPIDQNGKILKSPEMSSEFWKKANSLFIKYKGIGPSIPESLVKMINYQESLKKQMKRIQDLENRSVIYPGSGNIMRASRITLSKNTIIDISMYRQTFATPEEVGYLVSLMNNPGLTDAFADARRSDRHFHTHVWKYVPIPKFDSKNPDHVRLAELCEEAEKETENWYNSDPKHAEYGQRKASSEIREMLTDCGIFAQINSISAKILPNQTRPI